jgi:hypothetical protein
LKKKIINALYEKDSMNQSKNTRLTIIDPEKIFFAQDLPEFKSSRTSRDQKYLEKNYKTYSVNTTIQEAVFTLDNAKYLYINFVYDFIYRCTDMLKIHFIEGDTDSVYYAISENQDE